MLYKVVYNQAIAVTPGLANRLLTRTIRKTVVSADYPRDLIGYGPNPPHPHWPDNARIALSFVLNYEEGGERNILHGDKESEAFLSEMVSAQPLQGAPGGVRVGGHHPEVSLPEGCAWEQLGERPRPPDFFRDHSLKLPPAGVARRGGR